MPLSIWKTQNLWQSFEGAPLSSRSGQQRAWPSCQPRTDCSTCKNTLGQIIIWGANHPYLQLRAELRRTRLQVFEKLAFKGAFGCQPHQPIVTTEHSQRSKVFDCFLREENRMVWKTLVAQQRINAQLNSNLAPAVNQSGVTLVRGERFTHKPTMPPMTSMVYWTPTWWVTITMVLVLTLTYL